MNYLKNNHLSLLIIFWLVISGIFGGATPVSNPITNPLGGTGSTDPTTISNPVYFTNTNGAGITIAESPDGFVAYGSFTIATGTAKAVYTNQTGSTMMCDADSGYVIPVGTTFAPSIVFSLGTSTSATGYAANLLSSTTVATTTSPVVSLTYALPFKLANGDSIVGAISDYSAAIASSTYFSNWTAEFAVHCWTTGR
jgi:hypothetical protein